MSGRHELVRFWRDAAKYWRRRPRGPYIHPDDLSFLNKSGWNAKRFREHNLTFETFLRHSSFGQASAEFQFSLLPQPYVGDLAKADIFVLLLNPGCDYVDFYAHTSAHFRRSLMRNLSQHFQHEPFPFTFLDPRYCWHDGFRYWERRLRSVLKAAMVEGLAGRNRDYYGALQSIASRLALIEAFPYHSSSFRTGPGFQGLPSIDLVKFYVQHELLARAKAGKILLILARAASWWGLHDLPKEVVRYEGFETRGAHLGSETRGGKAILNWLREHDPL